MGSKLSLAALFGLINIFGNDAARMADAPKRIKFPFFGPRRKERFAGQVHATSVPQPGIRTERKRTLPKRSLGRCFWTSPTSRKPAHEPSKLAKLTNNQRVAFLRSKRLGIKTMTEYWEKFPKGGAISAA